MADKEEYAIVLDYLPYGYPLEKKMMPIAQAVGEKNFTLLQLIPRKGVKLELNEKVYIGEGKRDKIYYILGKLPSNKLTEPAKQQLQEFIGKEITNDEKKFVDFFNSAIAINTRLHQFELLPGFGKKHTEAILNARKNKTFESLEDLKKRVSNLPDPKKAIERRIVEEITGRERYNLFIKF
jgi:putative nucleotide binding protein